MGDRGGLGGRLVRGAHPDLAAVQGCLVDVVVPGSAGDVIHWVDRSSAVTLADQDPNPAYDPEERLWHLRFRAEQAGTVVLRLVRDRPGRRPLRTRVTLRIRPEHPGGPG